MPEPVRISMLVNGEARTVEAWPMERLLDVLRDRLGLTGTKEGCGEGECGACAVIMDGKLVTSCLVPALEADGAAVATIEGLAVDGDLEAVQRAMLAQAGVQCGFCTPGMVLAAATLCRSAHPGGEREIREGLSGNLCRCTGMMRILEAVQQAAGRSGG